MKFGRIFLPKLQAQRIHNVFLLTGFLLTQAAMVAGQEKPRVPLADDPTTAWGEVQEVHTALRPPTDWRAKEPTPQQVARFQKEVREVAFSFADKAREFIARFPTNENVGDARITVVHALSHAVAAGDTNAENQIAAFVSAVLTDKTIPEDDRVKVLMFSANVPVMKRIGMRLFTEGMNKLQDDFETAHIESMRVALKQFPTNSLIYTWLVAIAQRSKDERQKELATEILEAPGAPAGAKTLADHILNGTKPYQIGKPLDIRFTALDGREVDLAKLKGKVVLIEFWSTTCGPCIAEMPRLKEAYEKLHDRGFEVIAISLDDKEPALQRFIRDKQIPWPQHFDGKGWGNQFAVRYGIFAIPTVWLVDKRGNLRDTDARYNIEGHVASMLKE